MLQQITLAEIGSSPLMTECSFVAVAVPIAQANADAGEQILECRAIPAAAVLLLRHCAQLVARNHPFFLMAMLTRMLTNHFQTGLGMQLLADQIAFLRMPG